MTLEEYNKNLDGVISDLQSGAHGEIMVRMAMTALSLLRSRVQETGTNAKGAKYKPYSTKAMLVGCKSMNASVCNRFFGKENNKKHQWVTVKGKRLAILPGGYKQFRELHGRQTSHVDFSFSNSMWNDINVISNNGQHQQGIAVIGAKQDIEKKKLAGNTARRGDILDLSEKEIDMLKTQYNVGVLQIFRNNGL